MRRATRCLALCGAVLPGPWHPSLAQQDPATLDISQIVVSGDDPALVLHQPGPEETAIAIEQTPETTYDRCASAGAAMLSACDPQVVLIPAPETLSPEDALSLEPGGAYIRLGGPQGRVDGGQGIEGIVATATETVPSVPAGGEAGPVIVESTVPFVIESTQ